MQKVEGSSPFSRLKKSPPNRRVLCWTDGSSWESSRIGHQTPVRCAHLERSGRFRGHARNSNRLHAVPPRLLEAQVQAPREVRSPSRLAAQARSSPIPGLMRRAAESRRCLCTRRTERARPWPCYQRGGASEFPWPQFPLTSGVASRPWLVVRAPASARTVAAAGDWNGASVTNWESHAFCPPAPGLARRAPAPNLD